LKQYLGEILSITKRPKALPTQASPDADAFINAAPDASARRGRLGAVTDARKNKVQIAFTIDPDLLASVDAIARKKGLSRAGTISLACAELVERLLLPNQTL
jgi:hypothetical protein